MAALQTSSALKYILATFLYFASIFGVIYGANMKLFNFLTDTSVVVLLCIAFTGAYMKITSMLLNQMSFLTMSIMFLAIFLSSIVFYGFFMGGFFTQQDNTKLSVLVPGIMDLNTKNPQIDATRLAVPNSRKYTYSFAFSLNLQNITQKKYLFKRLLNNNLINIGFGINNNTLFLDYATQDNVQHIINIDYTVTNSNYVPCTIIVDENIITVYVNKQLRISQKIDNLATPSFNYPIVFEQMDAHLANFSYASGVIEPSAPMWTMLLKNL